jgi:myo-inositol-1(or 4)-monophosphatase
MVDWNQVLLEATEKAQRVVSRASRGPDRGRIVGTGASGDKTLVADRDAERVILDCLSGIPRLRILSEEKGNVGRRDADFIAIVDPLDGSSNFQRGIPFYCVSIGVVQGTSMREMKYALIRNLVNGDVYYAEKSCGVTKNGRRITTSQERDVAETVVGIDISRAQPQTLQKLSPLVSQAKRQVHFGANALELCMLAEGNTNAFVDIREKTRIVDFAGGYLIATEAGATFTTPEGAELQPRIELDKRFSFVASANPQIHTAILRLLTS